MTEEQINCLARYLGCKCNYLDENESEIFKVETLNRLIKDNYGFNLYLKPLSALTQEDYYRMVKEVNNWDDYKIISYWPLEDWIDIYLKDSSHLNWRFADWLRKKYYLEEKSIKEFVKLK